MDRNKDTDRDRSPIAVMGKTDSTQGNEFNLLPIKVEINHKIDASGSLLPPMAESGDTADSQNLPKLLMDERMQCEYYKVNYQNVKAGNERLQDEYTKSQYELKQLLSEEQAVHEKIQQLFSEHQEELLSRRRELENLKMQVITLQKLELLKAQIQEESESPMAELHRKLENVMEKYRTKYNKLHYKYALLKSELKHQQEEHSCILEEKKIQYEAEVARLDKDKEELHNHLLSVDPTRDSKCMEALSREKAQLIQKIKGLEAEVKELRAERDNCSVQAESVQRVQVQQLAEMQAMARFLEVKKKSAEPQIDRIEKELQMSHEQNFLLSTKLHKLEREVNSLVTRVEELKLSHKLEITNVKLEAARTKSEIEKERNKIQSKMDGLLSDVEILKTAVEHHKDLLLEKVELIHNVQADMEVSEKIEVLQDEKLELENKLADLDKMKRKQDTLRQSEKDQYEEKLHVLQVAEESSKKEFQHLRCLWAIDQSELEEKHLLTQRMTEKEEKYNQMKSKLCRAAVVQKKRKTLNDNKQRRIREKLELVEAKVEELENEKQVLNRHFSSEEYAGLQKRLKDLQHRHTEFRSLILNPSVPSLNPGAMLSSALPPGPEVSFSLFQKEQHQRELSLLCKRLEESETTQTKQLQDLGPSREQVLVGAHRNLGTNKVTGEGNAQSEDYK
ncbi:LOW QUALITY PROTEIN: centrosomal protein of 83 kDa [Amazona ochrocephala]